MTKQEFQKRIGAEISQKDYSIVEHVYTWHPSISEVEGKEQIAELREMVKEVNDNQLAPEEILGYEVYRYNRETGEVEVAV